MKAKRILSFCLSVMLIFTLLPGIALAESDNSAKIKSDIVLTEGTLAGRSGIEVEWKLITGGVTIGGGNVSIAYDNRVFELVDSTGKAVVFPADTPPITNDAQLVGYPAFTFVNDLYALKEGDFDCLAFIRGVVGTYLSIPDGTVIGKCFLAYKDGKSKADVNTDALRLATYAEADKLGQSNVVYIFDDTYEYQYGTENGATDTEGWAENISFGKGFDFAKEKPTCNAPTDVRATYGQTLNDISLTNPQDNTEGSWSWADGTKSVGQVGDNTHKAIFTPTDTKNYATVNDIDVTVSVGKGTHKDGTASASVKYTNTAEQTVDLSGSIPVDCGTISEITVAKTEDTNSIIASSSGDVAAKAAKFALASGLAAGGQTATLTATVKTANYEGFNVVITVTTVDKEVPTVKAEAITVTYTGEAVPDSAIKGTASVEGTWSFQAGQNLITVAHSGEKNVTFTPTDGDNYAAVDTTVNVTINKATPAGKPGYTAITATGKTLTDAALTVGTITPSGGAISWDDGVDKPVVANTAYGWTYVPTDTDNYNNLTGTITPYVVSTGGGSHGGGGGGGGGSTTTTTDNKTDVEKQLSTDGSATISSTDLAKAKSLKLENKEIAIELNQKAITTVGTSSSLVITAAKADADAVKALKEESAAFIGSRPVFDVTAKYGGKLVTNFGNGTVQISIAYTPAEGEKIAGLSLYYLNGDKAERVSGSYYDEKAKSVVGETNHLSLYAVGYDESQAMNVFADVKADDWFRTAVYDLYNKNILSGKTKTTFAPQDNVTRAEFATILAKAAGADLTGEAKQVFGDVAADAWYAGAVAWANEAGVASGTGNGNFSPDANITRQDMAVMLTKYVSGVAKKELKAKNEAVSFTDSAAIAGYAAEAVKTMQTGGVISGVQASDGSYRFNPTANATRAEAASMVSGLLKTLQ